MSGSLYAAGSSSKASSVTIESGKGVIVSGTGSFDYTASLGVNNQLCDTILLAGTATGAVAVQPKNNDVLISGGSGTTQLTVFSDTVHMQDIAFTDPEGDVLITKTSGNIDVKTSSQAIIISTQAFCGHQKTQPQKSPALIPWNTKAQSNSPLM